MSPVGNREVTCRGGSTISQPTSIMKSSHIARRRRSKNSLIIFRLYKNGPPNEINQINQNGSEHGGISLSINPTSINHISGQSGILFYPFLESF